MSERPTEPGKYWRADEHGRSELVDVRWSGLGPRRLVVARFCDQWERDLSHECGEGVAWSGPVDDPFNG